MPSSWCQLPPPAQPFTGCDWLEHQNWNLQLLQNTVPAQGLKGASCLLLIRVRGTVISHQRLYDYMTVRDLASGGREMSQQVPS